MKRKTSAIWRGDFKDGQSAITTASDVLRAKLTLDARLKQ